MKSCLTALIAQTEIIPFYPPIAPTGHDLSFAVLSLDRERVDFQQQGVWLPFWSVGRIWLDRDSDGDVISDGAEDRNGRVDPGEKDPNERDGGRFPLMLLLEE